MKLMKFMLVLVLLIPLVSAGVTNPNPSNMQLTPGETGRFKFQIQALNTATDIECSFELDEKDDFKVEFDDKDAFVSQGEKKYFYGSIIMPDKIAFGSYSREFCVSCKGKTEAGLANINIRTCNLPINVEVLGKKTRENMYVLPAPKGAIPYLLILTITVWIIIAILALLILYFVIRWLKERNLGLSLGGFRMPKVKRSYSSFKYKAPKLKKIKLKPYKIDTRKLRQAEKRLKKFRIK